ncbi:hypothetical protein CLV24_109169 [Pontibacter ummariensis]|uniref:Uncharacterized protein n=1 Tax=Pontibacter ummariensis TaxID=1610492 RepID=A0A239FJN0_9BACT|nr:hypothetical protein [Pontibacter ummariensis]PRY12044.1 hypothetical protein CLV24_109169 [Pontibacter ummariensis]SNS57150.1 hypothetical protein SAMN06296052_1091 [Pontibacter ummariensis]
MARSSVALIQALRETAKRLADGARYQWGHMGSCNCGHLAQTITQYSKGKIHGAAMWRHGDWREQLRDYCPQSGLPMDEVIDQMLDFGLTQDDLTRLERLSHPAILARLPQVQRHLQHNKRNDVVLYLTTWATMLEEDLTEDLPMPSEVSLHSSSVTI